MEELLNKLKELSAIRAIGDYADYEPDGKHKDTIYFAEDEEKIYLNGKNYGGSDISGLLEDYAKVSDLDNYATKDDIKIVEIPTSVYDFNNIINNQIESTTITQTQFDDIWSYIEKAYNTNRFIKIRLSNGPSIYPYYIFKLEHIINSPYKQAVFSSYLINSLGSNGSSLNKNYLINHVLEFRSGTDSNSYILLRNLLKQTTGTSTTDVMSQKACTDSFAAKANTYTKTEVDNKVDSLGLNLSNTWEAQLQDAYNDKVDKVEGKQLSTEDFTTTLKQKLEGLTNYDDSELDAKIAQLQTSLNTILDSENTTAVIDTWQEIESFLQGITNTETLTGLLNDLKSDILALCANTYLPLSGGTITGALRVNGITDRDNTQSLLTYHESTSGVTNDKWSVGAADSEGVIRSNDSNLKHYKFGKGSYKIWDEDNDGVDSGLDADLLDGKHNGELTALNFKTLGIVNNNYPISQIDNGGIIVNYNDYHTWQDAPNESSYGGAFCFAPTVASAIRGELFWDINHNDETDITRKLWWRARGSFNNVDTWGKWHQIAFTDSNVASADKLTTKQLTNEDLNEIKGNSTNNMYVSSTSNTCSNKPTGVTGFNLIVYRSTSTTDNNCWQILTAWNTEKIYKRWFEHSSSQWGQWKELATTDDPAPKLTTKQLTNENLNTIKDNNFSVYYALGGNTCTNKPDGVIGFNLIVKRAGGSPFIQILDSVELGTYRRFFVNNAWTPWKRMLTEDDIPKTWIGTEYEYSKITTKDSNTMYYIKE